MSGFREAVRFTFIPDGLKKSATLFLYYGYRLLGAIYMAKCTKNVTC